MRRKRSNNNAQKLGLYSTDVVVESLGETKKAYAKCRQGFFQAVNPEDAVEESICEDAVENFWRRRRVRRAESAVTREVTEEAADPGLLDLLRNPKVDDLEVLPTTSPKTEVREKVLAVAEQMSRAETRYDRRFYKAVATLYMIKALKIRLDLGAGSFPQFPKSKGDSGES
jgi:hypothetical protein